MLEDGRFILEWERFMLEEGRFMLGEGRFLLEEGRFKLRGRGSCWRGPDVIGSAKLRKRTRT